MLQASFLACALLMGFWVDMPWCGRIGLGFLSAAVIAGGASRLHKRPANFGWLGPLAICFTISLPLSLWWSSRGAAETYFDFYYSVLAWFVAAAAVLTCKGSACLARPAQWKVVAAAWAFLGDLLWVGAAYLQNKPGAFFLGLAITLALLVACKCAFVLSRVVELTANTLLLLVIGLPFANLLLHPTYALHLSHDVLSHYSTYEGAKKNRNAFEQWWTYYWDDWLRLEPQIMVEDETAPVRFRLRPNTHGTLVQSLVSINSKGFRGPEVLDPGQNAYRIIVLGESSTFGLTIGRDDKPWPELLENMVASRLKPRRRVEVINAGVPKADLSDNLHRMAQDILPLKPDMIISYHGFNGFCLLGKAMPPSRGKPPPTYRLRPLQLLADVEYRLRLNRYRRTLTAYLFLHPPSFSNVTNTDYAIAYRELIQITHTNGIRLFLANFSMAVNEHSEPELMDFFRPRFPLLYFEIKANSAHDILLQQLVAQYPEVLLLDTHLNLDGREEKFLDLIHFNHVGDQQIAENVFNGICSTLKRDLDTPQ